MEDGTGDGMRLEDGMGWDRQGMGWDGMGLGDDKILLCRARVLDELRSTDSETFAVSCRLERSHMILTVRSIHLSLCEVCGGCSLFWSCGSCIHMRSRWFHSLTTQVFRTDEV